MPASVAIPWKPSGSSIVHHGSATANSTAAPAAAARCPARISTARAGITHTQWWLHEIGDTSSPVTPAAAAPPSQSPRRASAAAVASPTVPTVSGRTRYQAGTWASPPAIRVTAPYRDWLLT